MALHALVGWGGAEFGLFDRVGDRATAIPTVANATSAAEEAARDRPIEIEQLVEELKAEEIQTPDEKRREEAKKKAEEATRPEGQVVSIAAPPIEQRPDERARFLAEYDSKVARESRGRPGDGEGGAPEAIVGTARARAEATHPGSPMAHPGAPGSRVAAPSLRPALRGSNGEAGDPVETTDEGVAPRPGAPGAAGRLSLRSGEGGFPGAPGNPRPNLAPTEEMLNRAIGRGAGSPDWLREIDDGEATALNAKKWKYASFFNRLKEKVREQWNPNYVYERHDPGGNVYGVKDRVTVVRVHLAPDGKLNDVTLLQSSGVDFLDSEAMDAFRRAQPFMNPPPALIEADGGIHFTFGFMFELSGSTSVKVFKY